MHEKNDEKIILFWDDVFFQFGGQFGGAWGSKMGPKIKHFHTFRAESPKKT